MPPIKEKPINLEAETQAAKINLEMEAGKVLLAQSQKRSRSRRTGTGKSGIRRSFPDRAGGLA